MSGVRYCLEKTKPRKIKLKLKIIIKSFSRKFGRKKKENSEKDFIEGESEDIDDKKNER